MPQDSPKNYQDKFFILASSSLTRLTLLEKIGFIPNKIIASNIDESRKKREKPRALASRLALEKATFVMSNMTEEEKKGTVILSADTVISVGTRIVDKALTDEDVISCAKLLSGRNHVCYSSFYIIATNEVGEITSKTHKVSQTRIKWKHLSEIDIKELINSKEGIGKAGGYSIDGLCSSFVINMSGSHTTVMGLCLYDVRNALMTAGLRSKNYI